MRVAQSASTSGEEIITIEDADLAGDLTYRATIDLYSVAYVRWPRLSGGTTITIEDVVGNRTIRYRSWFANERDHVIYFLLHCEGNPNPVKCPTELLGDPYGGVNVRLIEGLIETACALDGLGDVGSPGVFQF